MSLILFFDTYIVAGIGEKGGLWSSEKNVQSISSIRDKYPAYQWQKKIDVVKYTLSSYAEIAWDKVIIRFECEDKNETEVFYDFCRTIFPHAKIEKERSATAKSYHDALCAVDEDESAWVFFSPNNDHPYIADPLDIIKYVKMLDIIVKKFPNNDIGLLFSHFTESMTDCRISDPQWGYFNCNFKKVIFENENIIVTKSNLVGLDSAQIFRLGFLKNIFSTTKNTGRVIRLEDTEHNAAKNNKFICVAPKTELCRHFDGYMHILDAVPPLFIPSGFFENDIKIRYCHDKRVDGWVSIDPRSTWLSLTVDIPTFLEDIPFFWLKRISYIDKNESNCPELNRENHLFYKKLRNPWYQYTKIRNIIRSIYIFLIIQGWKILRRKLRSLAIFLGIFEFLKIMKSNKKRKL